MDATFFSLVSTPVAPPSGAANAPAAADGQGVSGADFANLLSQMMGRAQRQGLAAGDAAALQAVALSPNIEVITADAPLPDNDSLLAFARSQGLDDGMIGALFVTAAGGEPGPAVPGAPTALAQAALQAQAGLESVPAVQAQAVAAPWAAPVAVALTQPGAATAPERPQTQPMQADPTATLTLATPAVAQTLPGQASGPISVSPLLVSTAAPTAPRPSASGAPSAPAVSVLASPGPLASVAAARLGAQTVPGLAMEAHASQAAGLSEAPTAAGLAALGGAALRRLDMQWSTAVPPATPAAGQAEAAAQVQALASAPAVLQNALRLRLQPQEAITRRLADLAASGQQALWGELSASAAGEPDLLHLDLGNLPVQALEEWAANADALTTPQAGQPAGLRHATQALLPTAAQDPGALPDRVAQYEQLAQRLGQALGQRLQAQIERGQWKVQMQVDPASLGRIDMELDMRGGGLDAVFRSDNALTRELITQGLPRLRESLAQSGTTVASVWVQGDGSRQSGGNPTPGRWAAPGRGTAGKAEEVAVEPGALPARPSSNSAWDLLA